MRFLAMVLVALLTSTCHTFADAIRDWIFKKIESDAEVLTKSILKIDGYDIELIATSKWYVPFFLELPSDIPKSEPIPEPFTRLVNRFQSSFVPGGYLFRISFQNGYTLYALSAGDWEALRWFDPAVRKEFIIEPASVRVASDLTSARYVTVLGGVPPRFVAYDGGAAVVQTHEFDLHSSTIENDIALAIRSHATQELPTLQMVLLGEYLEGGDLAWRPLSPNPYLNFRNQQTDPGEKLRIARFLGLRREQAKYSLRMPSPSKHK